MAQFLLIVVAVLCILQTQAGVIKLPSTLALEEQPQLRTRRQANTFNFHHEFLSTPEGHGLSAGLAGAGKGAFRGNIQGQVGILNTPNHHLQVYGQHQKTLSSDFHLRQLAPDVNTLGLKYQHSSGTNAFVAGSHPAGTPFVTATGGVTVPIANDGNTKLGATYSNTFGRGMKPEQDFGLTLLHEF